MRAIVFPPNEHQPRFVWLAMTCDECRDSIQMKPHFSSVLGGEDCAYMGTMHIIPLNPVTGRKLTDSIMVSSRQRLGGQPNKAFGKFAPHLSEHAQGPVVLHGEIMLDPGQHHSVYDLAACELRHCIDFFNYQADDQRRDALELPGEDRYTGVVVNCTSDQHFLRFPAYQPVSCALNHALTSVVPEQHSEGLAAFRKIELPLLI